MFRRALLIMTVVFAGAACEELPEPKTPCRTEQECREQAKPTYSYWRSEMYVLPSWISSRSSVWWRSCL